MTVWWRGVGEIPLPLPCGAALFPPLLPWPVKLFPLLEHAASPATLTAPTPRENPALSTSRRWTPEGIDPSPGSSNLSITIRHLTASCLTHGGTRRPRRGIVA